MTKNARKLELIAQLLAKAERTTPEEAEALTEHATRLMIKYGIEQAQIDARRAKLGQASEQIVEQRITLCGVYALDMRDGLTHVVHALGMKALVRSYDRTTQVLIVVGFESDVRQAEMLIGSLQLQAVVAMRDWWRGHRAEYWWAEPHGKQTARGQFIRAFGSGAAARIRENRQHQVVEAGNGTDLVLASREQRVADFVSAKNLKQTRQRKGSDPLARMHGYTAGQNANTGERALGERHAALSA